jgi:hypothetical protein
MAKSTVRAQFSIHPGLDLAVEQHARRAGITKEQMYERLASRALDLFSVCDACVMGTCTSIFHEAPEVPCR